MRAITMLGRAAAAGARVLTAPVVVPRKPMRMPARSLHASSSVSRKKPSKPIEEDEFEAEEEEIDLFDSSSSASSADRSTRRAAIISEINALRSIDAIERRSAIAAMRVGSLRRVIQLSDSPEELEGLRAVLKTWRWAGKRVTRQTAKELIGRCCNLGQAGLALEFSEKRLQYGLPELPDTSLSKLHHALLSSETPGALPTIPSTGDVSPTLALLRIALLSRQENAPVGQTGSLLERIKQDGKESVAAPEWREDALKLLESAGGTWLDAGRRAVASIIKAE